MAAGNVFFFFFVRLPKITVIQVTCLLICPRETLTYDTVQQQTFAVQLLQHWIEPRTCVFSQQIRVGYVSGLG